MNIYVGNLSWSMTDDDLSNLFSQYGTVTSVSTGIAKVSGLPWAGIEELLEFSNGLFGIACHIDASDIGVILLGKDSLMKAGDEVKRTGVVMDIRVGASL